ncbi:MAG: ion transporter [bacterium]|nr:ion transporter [bacterium]
MQPWRERVREIIFEAGTPAGKAFDVGLLAAILLSVLVVILDSVSSVHRQWGWLLRGVEWTFTLLFTVEYVLRLLSVAHPWRYARSFFGIVDLLAIIPTYLSVVVPGTHSLLVIRTLRLLRVFRIFKLGRYVGEAETLARALRASRPKILVFLWAVVAIIVVAGSTMYLVEGEASGFTSIPVAMYWAAVTLTTVGYGDIAPQTTLGRILATGLMITGYGIIAIPTGIVSVELADARRRPVDTHACRGCGAQGHDPDARYCNQCGEML